MGYPWCIGRVTGWVYGKGKSGWRFGDVLVSGACTSSVAINVGWVLVVLVVWFVRDYIVVTTLVETN